MTNPKTSPVAESVVEAVKAAIWGVLDADDLPDGGWPAICEQAAHAAIAAMPRPIEGARLAALIEARLLGVPFDERDLELEDQDFRLIIAALRTPTDTGLLGDGWTCSARKQTLPEPADCNWPVCGCDPAANKVIDALEESGVSLTAGLVGELVEALEGMVAEKCDYMLVNRLGDPEQQHTVRQARAAIAAMPRSIEDAGKAEEVGLTSAMPGSNGGFSMCVFETAKVPIGTPLYAYGNPRSPDAGACVGCDGNPAPENNPCAVCGLSAPDTGLVGELVEALEKIAASDPRPEKDDDEPGHRCAHCMYRWKDTAGERHAPDCAYVIARTALSKTKDKAHG